MKKDLTIDVGVLMAASGLGAAEYRQSSLALAEGMESTAGVVLALDRRGRIEQQYAQKMKPGTYGHELVRRLAKNQKIVYVEWRQIDRGTRTALKEAHFDWEDFKYVETAAVTKCGLLVSHDPDYSVEVRRALRRVSVRVRSAREAGEDVACDAVR